MPQIVVELTNRQIAALLRASLSVGHGVRRSADLVEAERRLMESARAVSFTSGRGMIQDHCHAMVKRSPHRVEECGRVLKGDGSCENERIHLPPGSIELESGPTPVLTDVEEVLDKTDPARWV